MPYNNTPITPSAVATGTANLPLARVKKILSADEDIASCSNNAAFILTIAAEMFIHHLVEQTHTVVKTERKQRRQIHYRDVANAVSRIDNLNFLADVVPRTTTVRKVKEARRAAAKLARANGQATLDGLHGAVKKGAGGDGEG
ncbi:histone-fold-containing protein, partial [Pseudovirgaria hyperparasitica]